MLTRMISIRPRALLCKIVAPGPYKIGHPGKIFSKRLFERMRNIDDMKRSTRYQSGLCTALLMLAIVGTREVAAHDGWTEKDCEKTRQKIEKLESKMRQGYSASQGVKMADELRRLRRLRSKQCR